MYENLREIYYAPDMSSAYTIMNDIYDMIDNMYSELDTAETISELHAMIANKKEELKNSRQDMVTNTIVRNILDEYML